MTWGGAFDSAIIHVTSSVHTITNVYAKKDGIVYTGISTGTNAFDIKVNDKGTYEIWASVDGVSASKVDSVTVNQPEEYSVEILVVSSVLNDNSWAVIKRVSGNNKVKDFWSIGDKKEITLNGNAGSLSLNNVKIYAFIIGINHNAFIEGRFLHFQLGKDASEKLVGLYDSYYGRSNRTTFTFRMENDGSQYSDNSLGWAGSYMRQIICKEQFDCFPSDLKNVMAVVDKPTDNQAGGGSSTNMSLTSDEIFLASYYEILGTTKSTSVTSIQTSNPGEVGMQKQYAYYESGNSHIAYKYNDVTSAIRYWTRSPAYKDSTRFCAIFENGAGSATGSYGSWGALFCFCV